ncbi:hypothetical protein GLOTRDRAFT_126637 [Gloeophyllum trabeum ATCC 11539]|uniref:Uncharacterized protein n=1 Tax=Gloeophyllum trabeum (strain ATCC 11539 / FP-39264 / Madison 617) TaxID=670483 RepID=S7QEB0_GLOTA|nr:uncharacterized protein GLOTRDRAFT_126637 [Gloeophyllum trabeum ATCC 11539]EPQ58146.1 hypothetical protein GLOTRDRAFT_126637 [Gloeophyllum trabeum ATCC 11539]
MSSVILGQDNDRQGKPTQASGILLDTIWDMFGTSTTATDFVAMSYTLPLNSSTAKRGGVNSVSPIPRIVPTAGRPAGNIVNIQRHMMSLMTGSVLSALERGDTKME